MKILVTGATGFLGNEVITRLIESDHEIIATSTRPPSEASENFKWFKKVEFIQKNLHEPEPDFFDFFKKPDLLIHLAWSGLPNYKELFHIEKNLFNDYHFLKNMLEKGIKKISVTGTCFEYGMQNGCLSEDMDTKPVTCYGLAKDTLRKFTEELLQKYPAEYNWIRIFYPYGEGQSVKSLYSQMLSAVKNKETVFNMSKGDQLRDYLSKEKMAEYIIRISIQHEINGIVNCCSGNPVSVKAFVEDFFKEKKHEIQLNTSYYPYPDYEPMAFWGNASKLKKILEK